MLNSDDTKGVENVAPSDCDGDWNLGIGFDPNGSKAEPVALLGLWTEHLKLWMSKESPCKGD